MLFADLVGFTPFAEERDSEEVRETLTRYFDLASEIVGRYGGTVEKFIGDAVMAVWGTPTAREDDAERSVRAALDLVDAVHVLGAGISARAGIVSGEAAVNLSATNQGMVAGDIVNTAARLQAIAAPGTVLVGESTQRATSASIAFEPVGEQTLKGKSTPVPAFRAVRVVAERGGRGRSATLEAPFVGRDDDLRLLKNMYHATVRESRTRLVSVNGVAGIGKSRLAWEFEKYLDGIVGTVWWHRGRSPAYGEGLSFWPLGEMVRTRAGLAEGDDEATTRARIRDLVETHITAEPERRWIEPALLALLGIETGISSDQLFGAWRTFFERLSASGPVVLVFEDLHWADSGTLDFVDHVMEWSRSAPLFIIALARPELIDRRPEWGSGRRGVTGVYLEPLPEPAMRALLAGLVPGLPESAVRSIITRAEGIPLYAVETVRMLVTDGRVARAADGTYTPTGDLAAAAIPATLTALIGARLDSLDPADRALVRDASVLGQSFSVPALAAVSGTAEADLDERLRALVRRDLFAHQTDPRSPERGQYAFVQGLIREVAYNTLARRDRKTRHLAAARYFETLETDEIAAALAGHYLAARDNATEEAEAQALGIQARIALRGAAERASSLGGNDQALAFWEQALAATDSLAERADVLLRAGETASIAGRHETAEQHLRAAIAARRELGDRPGIAAAVTELGRVLSTSWRPNEALAVLEPALAEFADIPWDPAVIGLTGQLARGLLMSDHDERAVELADRVLALAEPADLRAIVADTLVTKGTALMRLHRPFEGMGLMRAGKALAESLGESSTVLRVLNNLSSSDDGPVLPQEALGHAREGLALARRLGIRSMVPSMLSSVSVILARRGDWASSLSELDAERADDYEVADAVRLINARIYIQTSRGQPFGAEVARVRAWAATDPSLRDFVVFAEAIEALAAGRWSEERDLLHKAVEYEPQNAGVACALAARAAIALRDVAAARADLETSEASAIYGPVVEADRITIRAGLAALEGRDSDARELFREALRRWRELGYEWDAALAALDMIMLLPSEPDAHAAAEQARELFVRLEAKPYLERLDAAMAASAALVG